MKICKTCGSTYGDKVAFCFRDGQPLVLSEDVPGASPKAVGGPLGLAAMLDVADVPLGPRGADPTDLPDPTALPVRSAPSSAVSGFDLPEPGGLSTLAVEDLPPAAPMVPPAESGALLEELSASPSPSDSTLDPAEPAAAPVGAPVDGSGRDDSALGVAAPDEALPPPRSLGSAGADPDALADIARQLGSDTLVPTTDDDLDDGPVNLAVSPQPSARASMALDDLATTAPEVRTESVIGLDGTYEDEVDAAAAAPPKSRLAVGLFAGMGFVAVVGVVLVLVMGGEKDPGPMATKPEERAAPVVAAPAPPAPPPVAEVEPPVDPTLGDPALVDPAAGVDPVASLSTPPATTPPAVTPPAATPPAATPPAATPPVATITTPPAAAPTAAAAAAAAARVAPTTPTATATESETWSTGSAATSGRLTITSIPTGATVYIDNKQVGRSPVSTEITMGAHSVRLELGGYSSESKSINLNSPEMAASFELKPLVVTGTVNIFGPTGAVVLVDGAQVGKIPTTVKLTEGAHTFEVRTVDGTSYSSSRDVRFNGGSTVTVTLSP